MQVQELMTETVRVIDADATVRRAAEEMAATNIGALPVARDRTLIGMVTDRDIAVRAIGRGLDPDRTTVGDIMTGGLVAVTADQDVSEAVLTMQEKQVRRAPVMDREMGLVGILSLGDIAVRTGDARLSGDALRAISEPTPNR